MLYTSPFLHPSSTFPSSSIHTQCVLASFVPKPFWKICRGSLRRDCVMEYVVFMFLSSLKPRLSIPDFVLNPGIWFHSKVFIWGYPLTATTAKHEFPHQYIMCSKHSLLTNSSPSVPPHTHTHTCTHMHTHTCTHTRTHTHTLASRGEHAAPHCSWRAQG